MKRVLVAVVLIGVIAGAALAEAPGDEMAGNDASDAGLSQTTRPSSARMRDSA